MQIFKCFYKRKKINQIVPIKRNEIKKLSKKDKENLHQYFKDLKFREPNIIDLGEDEDRLWENHDWEIFVLIRTSGTVIHPDMFSNPQIKLSILNNLKKVYL